MKRKNPMIRLFLRYSTKRSKLVTMTKEKDIHITIIATNFQLRSEPVEVFVLTGLFGDLIEETGNSEIGLVEFSVFGPPS